MRPEKPATPAARRQQLASKVLDLRAAGLTWADISERLGIGKSTACGLANEAKAAAKPAPQPSPERKRAK